MSFVPKDVVIVPECSVNYPDHWVAMNVFARTSLGVSSEVMSLLGTIASGSAGDACDGLYRCWEIDYFSNENGLLADPSRFRRDPAEWRELRLDRAAVLEKLKAHCILVDDEAAYRERFQEKRNLLDFQHFGNFHQQHGQHMMVVKRDDPARWWMWQKFSPDYRKVREDTLYGAVQWCFLQEYFRETVKLGMRVVDVGCGTGIYSNLIAECGGDVLGIDPSDRYLQVARDNAATGAEFLKAAIGELDGMACVPDGSVDLMFMSDALLFYFVPFFPGQNANIQVLLAEIKRKLKPGGRFISLEPHGVFYLNPWLGAADRPFTILTEYQNKQFGIVPPFSWLIKEFKKAGFAVTDLQELAPAEYFKDVDPRAYHFAREFPMWQLLELVSIERPQG